MERLRFGYHTAAGGIGVPRQFYETLDAAQIPFFAMGADGFPFDAQRVMLSSSVQHTVAFRRTKIDGIDADALGDFHYNAIPEDVADSHWQWHFEARPDEMSPRTWMLTVNEPRKELQWAPWLGRFLCRMAQHALDAEVRYCDPGFSRGTPDEGFWEVPEMLAYLRMCAEHSDLLGIALHEYSGRVGEIWYQRGDLVGRFKKLFDACDRNGIARPKTLITEFGWAHDDAPPVNQAMADYLSVGELYAQYPEILGAATWYLGPGYGDIKEKVKLYFSPLLQLTLDTTFDPPPPPPGDTWEQRAWAASVAEQIARGIPLNPAAGLQQAIFHTPWFTPVHREITIEGKTIQAAEDVSGQEARRVYVYEPGKPIWSFEEPGSDPPPTRLPVDPLSQRDPRWRNVTIGQPTGHGKTIGNWGCLLVAYNMMSRYWGLSHLLPDGYNQFMVDRGAFDRQYLRPGALAIAHAGQVVNNGWLPREDGRMIPKIKEWIDNEIPVPAQVDFDPSTRPSFNPDVDFEQHWVLVIGYTPDDFIVADPWHGDIILLSARYGIPGTDVIQACFYSRENQPPPPPPTGDARIGLHARADPTELPPAEYAEFRALRAEVIKVLSAHPASVITRLAIENPGIHWIVRAFLQWGGRSITPEQFVQWTRDDTTRAVNALIAANVSPGDIIIELGNEPNLVEEGWTHSWANGGAYATWLGSVVAAYRGILPGVKMAYPGLSPGWSVPGVRFDSTQFMIASAGVLGLLDALCIHAYWSASFPMTTALAHVDSHAQYNKPIWVSEASRNDRPSLLSWEQYAEEYRLFWQELQTRPFVQGVTYFVASASNPFFDPECWIGPNGQSRGIAEMIRT